MSGLEISQSVVDSIILMRNTSRILVPSIKISHQKQVTRSTTEFATFVGWLGCLCRLRLFRKNASHVRSCEGWQRAQWFSGIRGSTVKSFPFRKCIWNTSSLAPKITTVTKKFQSSQLVQKHACLCWPHNDSIHNPNTWHPSIIHAFQAWNGSQMTPQ